MKQIFSTIIVFIALGCHSNAQAILDQNNTGSNPTFSLIDALQSNLQTFTPAISGQLIQVKVDIETQNCPYPLICKILDIGNNSAILATELMNIPVFSPRNMLLITFSNPPVLIGGNLYAIALYSNCISSPGQSDFWYKSVNDAYENGQAYNQWGSFVQPEDTLNDFYFQTFMLTSSGVFDVDGNSFSIYPNPSTSLLYVESNEMGSVEMYDLKGQLVYNSPLYSGKSSIDLSAFTQGTYLLRVKTNTTVFHKKILKI